ncbi:MAG: 50S ribosomal protein L21 [Candidatus Portnoybacteria bacterium]|nr:50S ribosomal protein L21 [Candidatus Portnoybacteria bacterium]
MLAVIKTGGKQYLVKKGDKIEIEKINKKEGDKIEFTDVLLIQKNKKTEVGRPKVKNTKVIAEIIEQGRGDKVIVFKYKSKKRYKKKRGHKQPYTKIEIKDITTRQIKKKEKPKKETKTKK